MPKDMQFDKLKGRENYIEWKRSMLAFLRTKKLARCIAEENTETDADKLDETLGWLVLAIESSVANHFNDEQTPLAIWKLLQKSFSESGLDREVSALLDLTSVKYSECAGMDDYIGRTLEAWKRCTDAKVVIADRVVALLLLGKLGSEYQPFIMGMTASGAEITVDKVKASLLSLVPTTSVKAGETAFMSHGGRPQHNKAVRKSTPAVVSQLRCFSCGQTGHFRRKCPAGNSGSYAPRSGYQNDRGANNPNVANAKFANAFSAFVDADSSDDWFIDSGASRHMTPRRDILTDFQSSTMPFISVANNARLEVAGCGTAFVLFGGIEVAVRNVLCVPGLKANLLSVSEIIRAKNRVTFDQNGCSVYNGRNELLVTANARGGTYKIEASQVRCRLAVNSDIFDWHRRLGHLGYTGMCKLKAECDGLSFSGDKESLRGCESCAKGKMARGAFVGPPKTEVKTKSILELLHMDVCGPMETKSLGGARYFVCIIDDFSRKVFVSFLTEKSAVVDVFSAFKHMAENQCDKKIKRLRSDNGTEFVNSAMRKICKDAGIVHETTVPYTPQQNGTAERMNRTIVERSKCMLDDADLGKEFWAEAVHHATYLINRSVNRTTGKTPEEIWSGERPNLSKLKMFGNKVMVHVNKQQRRKWDEKAEKMIFIGYADTQKGLRCFDLKKRKVVTCRDVVFLDMNAAKNGNNVVVDFYDDDDEEEPEETVVEEGANENDETGEGDDEEAFDDAVSDPLVGAANPVGAVKSEVEEKLRRSERSRTNEPKYVYLACDQETGDPMTPEDALGGHNAVDWRNAMHSELASLDVNNTWELMSLPAGRKAIKTKWVFKTKRDDDGTVLRYKARLVAKGCSQTYGVDYTETYSPVVRYTSLRLLIAMAAQRGLSIDQMDAITAYLQGDLDEEIYTQQPEGFDDGSGRVCKLKKAMYGLKQSGRQWNRCLDDALQSFGLIKSKIDMCVYYTKNVDLIIAIYVDDILICWKDPAVRDQIRAKLEKKFQMKYLGRAKTCVGLHIEFENDGISIGQASYAKDVLERFKMSNCKPVATPTDVSQKLMPNSPDDDVIEAPYQEAVGSLLYLVQGTRPDLAFAVNNVSRFNSNYRSSHWAAVKRIMRYLKGTINYRIKYKRCEGRLSGFVDADWAADVVDRRSCTGWVYLLAGGAVSWSSKRQKTVALSTTEAEYMAMSAAAQEAAWLSEFMGQFAKIDGVKLFCDNQGALEIAETEAFRKNTKHISIRYHFIREKVVEGLITLQYVPTEKNVADCLTKCVGTNVLKNCITGMSMYAS